MEENKALFETTPVPKALATLAIPTIISQLITMIYNLADTFFIGRTNDPYKVAAASLAYSLFFVMNALANLFGIGGGSTISRLLGHNRPDEAKRVSAFSFYGTILVSMLYALVCWLLMDPLLRLLGASSNTIGYASSYTFWVVVVGALPSTLSMTLAHLLRSEGYARQASLGLSIGGLLNIALDPLFMFVLMPAGQEVTGAALATLCSNTFSLLYYAVIFFRLRKKTVLSLSPKQALPAPRLIKPVFSVGLPSAIGTLLSCIAITLIHKLMSGHGDIPLAAIGIIKKIDMLPMNVGMGLCQGMIPLVAYNYAAGNYPRMKAFTNCARLCGICFAGLCILCFELFPRQVVGLFINDAQTVTLGANFLRIGCIATPLMITNFQMSYTFQAMGMGAQSLLLTSCRQGFINIPLLFLMDFLFGMYGIVWTQLLADGFTLIISFVLYRRAYRRLTEADAPAAGCST